MTKQNQKAPVSPTSQPKSLPKADAQQRTAAAPQASTPTAAGGAGSLPNLTASLGDARLGIAQRQAAASKIGQTAGNHYLTSLVSRSSAAPTAPAPVKRANQPAKRQPPVISSQPNQGVIARDDPDTETPAQPHVPFPPFGNLTRYAQLASAAQFAIGQLTADLQDVPAGHSVHQRATEFVDGLRRWLPRLQSQGDAPLTQDAANQARLHVDEGFAVRDAIAQVGRTAVQRAMDQVAAKARTTARSAEQLQPHVRDCLRAAYRSGDTDIIGSVAGTLGAVVDIGLGLHQLARDLAQAAASVSGIQLPAVGQYVTALERLNRGLAAFNLAFSLQPPDPPPNFDLAAMKSKMIYYTLSV